jgi:outer membrane protein OmpA-like peptidoglycan-associated protein
MTQMRMFTGKFLLMAIVATSCAVASAATPVAQVRGNVGDVPFPEKSRSYLSEGDFVNVDNLRQMRAGLSKDQVRQLLGHPHFKEGLFGVTEWNYIFNFHTGNGDEVITCQYQVRYGKEDGQYRAESMHWDGPACMELANRGSDTPATALDRFELSADALFVFAKSGPGDILPGGRDELNKVAEALKSSKAAVVQVIGHTDLIGSHEENQTLSQRRAETVREFLVDSGLPAEGLSAHGVGETEPVKQCDDGLPREELVACLQPNRRVEVVVKGLQ